jgi:UDP-3-O-[3-hydroxymyristoyl] glucosamine N-acyltransferase
MTRNPDELIAASLKEDETIGIDLIVGDANCLLNKAAPVGIAKRGSLTFAKEIQMVEDRRDQLVGAAVICPALPEGYSPPEDVTLLISENPRLSFIRAAQKHFLSCPQKGGVHPTAFVEESAHIHPTAFVGAFCYVGANSVIGEGTRIFPNVTIYENVRIGAKCRINSGTVIGADGYGYERNSDGVLEKFPHLGGVVIEDEVEIGANTCIDRGALADTRIAKRARVDNLVHIAHNVQIGEDVAVIALSMLGGSVAVGSGAWIAPGAVIMNQVIIGANSMVGLGAVVVKDVAPGQTVMGAPAQDSAQFKATRAAVARLVNE